MKKNLLILCLAAASLSAQNSQLFSNSWIISQITVNNQTTVAPVMQVQTGTSFFNGNGTTNYSFISGYYNSSASQITFSTTSDSFLRSGGGCTLAVYNGTNAVAAQAFDQKNCDFYMNSNPGAVFNYQIVTNGNGKTLIITKASTGDKIYYNSAFLKTNEAVAEKSFSIYPNPVKDILNINNAEKELPVKIFDLSGKLVLEMMSTDKNFKIDVSGLHTGQYILNIENFTSTKFSKN